MSKRARRGPNYDRKLARPIRLEDGRRLLTLKDAADLLAERFSTVRAWGALEHCIELLMQAATTGKRDDVVAATRQFEVVLRAHRLL